MIAQPHELLEGLHDALKGFNAIISALPDGDDNDYDPGQLIMDIQEIVYNKKYKLEVLIKNATPE